MITRLTDLVVASNTVLSQLGVPYAFGGAIALSFHSPARATVDVDVNVFVPLSEAGPVVGAFAPLGLAPETRSETWTPAFGIRLGNGEPALAVDLFFSVDEVYDDVLARVVPVTFGPDRVPIPVLSAEDIVMFKLSFGRPQDWIDLERLAGSNPDLDLDLVERLLVHLRGPTMQPRLARMRELVRRARQG